MCHHAQFRQNLPYNFWESWFFDFQYSRHTPSWIFKFINFWWLIKFGGLICIVIPNFTKIGGTARDIAFNNFQNGSRPPSWLFTVRCYSICHRCVSVCVCLSVTLRYCIKTAKRRIAQITPHDSPGILYFLMLKITTKFKPNHRLWKRQNQVGWVKTGHFEQITSYNSKTVRDRCLVSIKVE